MGGGEVNYHFDFLIFYSKLDLPKVAPVSYHIIISSPIPVLIPTPHPSYSSRKTDIRKGMKRKRGEERERIGVILC